MKKFFGFLLFIHVSSTALFAATGVPHGLSCPYSERSISSPFISAPGHLQPLIQTLLSLPETHPLIHSVQKEGFLTLKTLPLGSQTSNAYWEGGTRTIVLNASKRRTEGSLLRSILFEMHNASKNQEFLYYDHLATQGLISKKAYVETIERIEHLNALNTCDLIEKGIQKGVFPFDSRWPIPRHFAEHFKQQQQTGHSAHIAAVYDQLTRVKKG